MTKRILLIAYHFPPLKCSSGIQRALRYAQYLPEFGWEPIILTPHIRAYETVSDEDLVTIADMQVVRSFALDTRRHLSIRGRYCRLSALPDRWISWLLGAIPTGLKLIREKKPQVIWTTYPIATAHLIGLILHKITGIPWVANFRDPMAQDGYPTDRLTWKAFAWIERKTIQHANQVAFVTPGAIQEYTQRYPKFAHKFVMIENGYEESVFQQLTPSFPANNTYNVSGVTKPAQIRLVHSGVIYPSERDPKHFFAALANLKKQGIDAKRLRIILRATGHDNYLRPMLHSYGIEDMVELAPTLSYNNALQEMLSADGLLVLQASNCNAQIPAKLYEYYRSRRPILGLTDLKGDTANSMRAAGLQNIAPLDDPAQIELQLRVFIESIEQGKAKGANEEVILTSSRRYRTQQLVTCLDSLVNKDLRA